MSNTLMDLFPPENPVHAAEERKLWDTLHGIFSPKVLEIVHNNLGDDEFLYKLFAETQAPGITNMIVRWWMSSIAKICGKCLSTENYQLGKWMFPISLDEEYEQGLLKYLVTNTSECTEANASMVIAEIRKHLPLDLMDSWRIEMIDGMPCLCWHSPSGATSTC